MPDTERTAIMLANRVLRTLSNVALATVDQREDREVAILLHEQACQEWDRWRGPVCVRSAVGALDYLQHRSNL